MLSGVLGAPHINKAKAEKEAKLDKYLVKRNTQHANEGTANWDLTFLK